GRAGVQSLVQIVSALPGGVVRRQLPIIDGIAADIRADALQLLAGNAAVRAVSLDGRVAGSSYAPLNPNLWQEVAGVDGLWGSDAAAAPPTPTIAVIDSGVDGSLIADFGARLLTQVNLA